MKRRALGILAASLALSVVLVGGIAWWGVERRILTAEHEPRAIAMALTTRVALEFEGDPPLSHYYGALSSTKQPAWLRLPVGLVETLIRPGHCDSMARGLVFALKANGIEARQLDLFARTFTHSIVVAFPDGEPLLLDPYQRYVAVFESGGLSEWAEGTARLAISPLPGAPPSPQITSHLARDEPVTTISP